MIIDEFPKAYRTHILLEYFMIRLGEIDEHQAVKGFAKMAVHIERKNLAAQFHVLL